MALSNAQPTLCIYMQLSVQMWEMNCKRYKHKNHFNALSLLKMHLRKMIMINDGYHCISVSTSVDLSIAERFVGKLLSVSLFDVRHRLYLHCMSVKSITSFHHGNTC